MAHTVKPSNPPASATVEETGALTLITATTSGGAQTIWTPTTNAPGWEYLYLAAGSIHTATVKLSIGIGGVALGQVFEQDISPRSGFNVVLDWEELRAAVGPIMVWANVGSVITIKRSVAIKPEG